METDATYRKGYKQGVLDATTPMKEGDPVYNGNYILYSLGGTK